MFNLFRKRKGTIAKDNTLDKTAINLRIKEIEGKISREKDSIDYKNAEFTDSVDLIHSPDETIQVVIDYVKSNHKLMKNHLYDLNKQDLVDRLGECRVFEYEPIPLDCQISGNRVYVFSLLAGEIPDGRAEGGHDFQLYFNGFKYKELSTEDFTHYQMDREEASLLTLEYTCPNKSHKGKVELVENLEKELEELKKEL